MSVEKALVHVPPHRKQEGEQMVVGHVSSIPHHLGPRRQDQEEEQRGKRLLEVMLM